MEYFATTGTGKIRTNNEDSYFASDHIFLVANVMGGHNPGEIASSRTAEMFPSLSKTRFDEKAVLDKNFFYDIFQQINKKALEKGSVTKIFTFPNFSFNSLKTLAIYSSFITSISQNSSMPLSFLIVSQVSSQSHEGGSHIKYERMSVSLLSF